jgi:hypothetical protein
MLGKFVLVPVLDYIETERLDNIMFQQIVISMHHLYKFAFFLMQIYSHFFFGLTMEVRNQNKICHVFQPHSAILKQVSNIFKMDTLYIQYH